MTEPIVKTMRDAFIGALYERMRSDERIFFLSADFGAPALDALKVDFKDRFLNIGIAEQNTTNIAAGLALEGYIVYTYGIATFVTMRCFEQVRLNLAISSQIRPVNVNIIGVGAGLSYDLAGPTHHGFEDLSIMRILPNFRVFSPSDWRVAEQLVADSIDHNTPKYFRFDAKPLPSIYDKIEPADLEPGFIQIRQGKRVCLVSTGFATHRALKACERLPEVGLIDIIRLKPINEQQLLQALAPYDCVITVEEALVGGGGLDGLITTLFSDQGVTKKVKRLGFRDQYVFDLGSRDHLHRLHGIHEDNIVATAEQIIRS